MTNRWVLAPDTDRATLTVAFQEEEFIHKLWAPRPLITTGGYNRETGMKVAEETGQLIGYGSLFISNVRFHGCPRFLCDSPAP